MRNQNTFIQKMGSAFSPKKTRTAAVALAVSILCSMPARAFTALDVAAAADGLTITEQGALVSGVTNEKEFVLDFEHAVTASLRVCDAAELVDYPFQYVGHGRRYEISADKVNLLLTRQLYVQDWLEAHVPALVPAGTGREAAVALVFDYITSNYTYDYDAPDDFYASHDSQGAYRILLTGQGICSGYSKLFRGMVEYLPFNAEGVVDYEASVASRLSVALVSWTKGATGHEWNALMDPAEGVWYHYDLSETVTNPDGYRYFRLSDANIVGDGRHGRISEHIYEY